MVTAATADLAAASSVTTVSTQDIEIACYISGFALMATLL